ncbi:MAG TPA: hypothetical protein ENI74_09545 [Gammaproteobacteria bacterium]|nr:hypothetical protein [Gammaproteobacteria bacterium]
MAIERRIILALACIGIVFFCTNIVLAGTDNDVPSCYTANKIEHYSPAHDKLIYVLIDQTLSLDKSLQKSVLRNLSQILDPGTKFVVSEFSAFAQGRYLRVINTGVIEKPIPQDHIGDVVMTRLKNFQACLKSQKNYAKKLAVSGAYSSLSNSTNNLKHSDILIALKTVSTSVLQDSASEKLFFLVSDGLVYSSITSFYARRTLRHINVSTEIAKVKKSQLFGDFGGARVYVLGGADLPTITHGTPAQREGYRNPASLLALRQFWDEYFKHSNAKLVEFGEPALLTPVSFRKPSMEEAK